MHRDSGSGPCRLGKKLEMSEDLYSMFFVSNLNHEYIYYHLNADKIDEVDKKEHTRQL